jgi:hypothetical protein
MSGPDQLLLPRTPEQTRPERPRDWKHFREFKGMNTQSDRTSIPQDNFFYLENVQPIGPSNAHSVPGISASIIDYGADVIYHRRSVNVNNTEYIIFFATNGKVFAFNVNAGTSSRIDGGTVLSGSGSRCDQWKNSIILFIDSTGLYFWDVTGPTFAKITGAGVPSSGNDIAVYANRVWVVQGRLLITSAVDDYTAPAWTAANGAISTNLTDPTLRSVVTRLFAANGYLYFWGLSSINVISDVRIPSGASPPAPVFTNLNIHAIVGTDQPLSVFVWGRSLMFATRYGVYKLDGVNAVRVSEDIDGTWQNLDFSLGLSGGSVQLNNILCAAFSMKWNDTIPTQGPNLGLRTVLAIYFDKKWFFGNMGTAVTFIEWALFSNVPTLYGMIGNKLYKFFSDTTTHAATIWKTALWPMEDSLLDKETFAAALEYIALNPSGTISIMVDTEITQTPVSTVPNTTIVFINNLGGTIQFTNNLSQVITFIVSGYVSNPGDVETTGKYLGMTVTTTAGLAYQLVATHLEYKLGPRY